MSRVRVGTTQREPRFPSAQGADNDFFFFFYPFQQRKAGGLGTLL